MKTRLLKLISHKKLKLQIQQINQAKNKKKRKKKIYEKLRTLKAKTIKIYLNSRLIKNELILIDFIN